MAFPFPFAQAAQPADPRFFPSLGNDLMGRRPNLRDFFGMGVAPPSGPGPALNIPQIGPEADLFLHSLMQNPEMLATGTANPEFQYPGLGGLFEQMAPLSEPLATRDEADKDKMEARVFGEQILGNTLKLPQNLMDLGQHYIGEPWNRAAGAYGGGMADVESAVNTGVSDAATYMTSTVGENEERKAESEALKTLTPAHDNVNLEKIDPGTTQALIALQQQWGKPLSITSGYRSPEYNATLPGAATNSQHIHGKGVDISTAGMSDEDKRELAQMARQMGFAGLGVYDSHIHVDTREGGPAFWDKTGGDKWAQGLREIPLGEMPSAPNIPPPPLAGMPPYLPYPNAPDLPPPPGIETPDYAGAWDAAGMREPRTPNYGLVENVPGLTPPETIPEQVFRDFVDTVKSVGPEEPDQEAQGKRKFMAVLGGLAAGAAAGGDDVGTIIASMGAGGMQGLLQATEMELAEDKEYQEALRQHALAVAEAEMAAQQAITGQRNIGIDFENRETLRQYEGALAGEDLRMRHDAAMGQYRASVFSTMVRAAEAQTNAVNRVAERHWSWLTEGAKNAWETNLAQRNDFLRWGELAAGVQDQNAQRMYEHGLAQMEANQRARALPAAQVNGNNLIIHRKVGDQLVMEVKSLDELRGGLKQISEAFKALPSDNPARKVAEQQYATALAAGFGSPHMFYAMVANDLAKDYARLSAEGKLDDENFSSMMEVINQAAEARGIVPMTDTYAEFVEDQLFRMLLESITEDSGQLYDLARILPSAATAVQVMEQKRQGQ